MYRGKSLLVFVLTVVFLFGACGQSQSQYKFPELTTTPTVAATNTPTVEETSRPEPGVTVTPETDITDEPMGAGLTGMPTTVPKREEFSITEITGVVFELDVTDIGGRSHRMVAERMVFYYPQGESAYKPYHHVMTEGDFFVGEDEGLRMVITGLEWDETAEYYRMRVYFENKLDCPLTIHLDDVFINGFQLEPWRYRTCTVGASRGRYEELYLGAYVWELCEGEEITEFTFSVTAWSEDGLQYGCWDEPVTAYPLGKDAAVSYEYVATEDDITVFNTEDCRMVITNRGSVYGAPAVTVFLENKTEETLRFSCGGFWQDIWSDWVSWYSDDGWYTDLEAGRMLVAELKASDWNMTETEEGTKHTLSVEVSSGEEETKRELLQEEVEFVILRTKE